MRKKKLRGQTDANKKKRSYLIHIVQLTSLQFINKALLNNFFAVYAQQELLYIMLFNNS